MLDKNIMRSANGTFYVNYVPVGFEGKVREKGLSINRKGGCSVGMKAFGLKNGWRGQTYIDQR